MNPVQLMSRFREDPLAFGRCFWPNVTFYSKQVEVMESVRDNVETVVPAGNMLGKDFVSGFIALWYFLTNWNSDKERNWVRIITTSVKEEHLDVLWSEIGKFVANSKIPLSQKQGGPLVLSHHEMRMASEINLVGAGNVGNYVKGVVSAKGEGMQGRHAEKTLLIVDEASGVDDVTYEMAMTWAKKSLIIGNPHACSNFFYKGVKGGDIVG